MKGGKQLGLGNYEQGIVMKRTRCEQFLSEMEKLLQWKALLDLIALCSSQGELQMVFARCPPYPLAAILRIHLSTTSLIQLCEDALGSREPRCASFSDPVMS